MEENEFNNKIKKVNRYIIILIFLLLVNLFFMHIMDRKIEIYPENIKLQKSIASVEQNIKTNSKKIKNKYDWELKEVEFQQW